MNKGKLFLTVAIVIVALAALGTACVAVTSIASEGWDPGYPVENTVDGKSGVDADSGNWSNMGWAGSGAWVIYDLGWPRDVRKIRIAPPRYNGGPPSTFNPLSATVEFADEFLNYSPAITCSWPKLESTGRADFSECALDRADHNWYQYLRVTFPDGGRVGELWFSDSPQIAVWEMNQDPTYSAAYPAWQTADANVNTLAVITGDAGGQGEPYITYDTGLSQTIFGFTMQARAAWAAGNSPTGGELWVSDNPITGYTKMGNWSAPTWGDGETKTFYLGKTIGRYLQLRNIAGGEQWAEFRAIAFAGTTLADSWSGWYDSLGYSAIYTADGVWNNTSYANMGMCDPNAWVIYDFGTARTVNKVRITSPEYGGSGFGVTFNATGGTFEFSNDKSTWTTPISWSAPPLSAGAGYGDAAECAFDKPYTYRYARWTLTSGGRVGEIFFLNSPQTAVWEMNQDRDYSTAYPATQTVDNRADTLAVITGDTVLGYNTSGLGQPYITYDQGVSQMIYGFTMQARAAWADGNSPTVGELWVSDNPTTGYTKMGNWTAPTWANGEAKTFYPGTPLSGRYLQLRNIASGTQWAEFQVRNATTRPASIPYSDAVTVDGNLSDWAGANWTPLDNIYSGAPSDISEAYYSARWGNSGNKLYVAVKVRDTSHLLTDTYSTWDGRDAIEVYVHTTGTGPTAYLATQADAQQYAIGIKNSNHDSVWAVLGADNAIPVSAGFSAAGSVSGEWLYYEAAITPFKTFSLSGTGLVTSTLSAGQVIGLDVVAVGNNGSPTGSKSENLMTGKYDNYGAFGQHALGAPVIATFSGAKTAADGTAAGLVGTVTRTFGTYIYVEASDRSSGIRVDTSAAVSTGQVVSVSGVVGTVSPSGERKIVADSVTPTGATGTLLPLALNNKAMGGGNLGTLPAGQPGVSDGTGLNNIGLFVKASGKCTSLGGNLYSLNDGSGVSVTVQLLSGSVTGTPFISAQGIMSCTKDGSVIKRLLIVKDATDIQVSP